MAEKQSIIIKKKINKGGHGAHGGAWKVAYADFVTAMMAFFMVMWLMGTDETTKAAVAQYFNHPNTPFDPDLDPNANSIPRPGIRDSVLSGMDGAVPDDMVPNPVRAETYLEKNRKIGEQVRLEMEGQAFNLEVEIDYLKFSLPEAAIFKPGTSTLRDEAKARLDRLGEVLKSYHGYTTIEDYTNEITIDGTTQPSIYVASTIKSVSIMNYLVGKEWVQDEKIKPLAGGADKKRKDDPDSGTPKSANRVEFTLRPASKM